MEPITSFLASQAVDLATSKTFDLALGKIASAFSRNVVERWSKQRSKVFFDQFCRAVYEDDPKLSSQQLAELLDKIFEDKSSSELLFDAYRSVCLSRSKDIGPRIIAIVVAEAVCEERVLTDYEERILLAAENLSDDELSRFSEFAQKQQRKVPNLLANVLDGSFATHPRPLRVIQRKQSLDSGSSRRGETTIAPLNLATEIGSWAEKLSRFGLIVDDLTESQWTYEADEDYHTDEPGSVRELVWWVEISEEGIKLAELVAKIINVKHL